MEKERTPWIKPFELIGINKTELMKLKQNDFIEKMSFCIECGLLPDEIPQPKPKPQPKPLPPKTDSGFIRNEQDFQYKKAQNELYKLEEEEMMRKAIEESLKKTEKEKTENPKKPQRTVSSIQRDFQQIGVEPSKGISFAFMLPNKQRIIRKFSVETLGSDLFKFISVQECLFNKNKELLNFDIVCPIKGSLIKSDSLLKQGFTKSQVFNVVLTD